MRISSNDAFVNEIWNIKIILFQEANALIILSCSYNVCQLSVENNMKIIVKLKNEPITKADAGNREIK